MRTAGRLLAISLCCAAGLWSSVTAAFGAPSSSVGGSGSLSSAPLVTAGSPDEGQQAQAEREARLASPGAVAAQEESRTKYEGLNGEQAAALAAEAFPETMDEPSGGPPQLPAGEQIVGYPSDNAAQVALPAGKHGVIESLAPIALEGSSGQRIPVDLSLADVGSAFEPKTPVADVRIPKRLGEGVLLSGASVSLTPVNAQGVVLAGSAGALEGAAVLYANTATDADTVVKPVTAGFATDTMLRSIASPQQLFFRVGLPEGASLLQAGSSGPVQVVKEGVVIATIASPAGEDAAGSDVPVRMAVSGDTVVVSVEGSLDEYTLPVEVDPTVIDSLHSHSNWKAEPPPPSPFTFRETETGLTDYDEWGPTYSRGEWGGVAYETQGESHIYEIATETTAQNEGSNIENTLFIRSPGSGMEKDEVLGDSYSWTKKELCVSAGCATGTVSSGDDKNAVEFKQTATNPGNDFSSTIGEPKVYILQESPPTVTVNTASETIEGKRNIFHPGKWVGPNGAQEITGTDPGIGVSEFYIQSPNKSGWGRAFGFASGCNGVQCPESWRAPEFANFYFMSMISELPNGLDTVEITSKDAAGLTSSVSSDKVKVDYSLPYEVTLLGFSKELGDRLIHVKASAKDGSGTLESSGIESIALTVDGTPVGSASGSCSPGPCTATSNEWALNGAEYPAGVHKVVVTATSYAGDVASEEYTMNTGHLAAPVALGPGSVSPQTGEFFLNATDVSIGVPGGVLSLKRSYGSYHLNAGLEGPLGGDWSMSVGGSQNLTKNAEGGVVLTDAEGQQSVFTSKGGGEFNSPPSGSSLKLTEVSEHEKPKEFLLASASGEVTHFKLPSGGTGNTWVPAALEGPGATDVVTYAFKTVAGITEPTEVLAPVPAGVSCTAELVKGCRALGFVYATATTAKGEGSSEWGAYEGRLKEVTYTAWEPAAGKMKTVAVAQYAYDKQGRLRGEWDPRVSPALESTCGYDAAGHVTATTAPGQQPWLFSYGAVPGDPRPRMLAVTRPSAATVAGDGVAPVNTIAPALVSTTARVGVPLSVSTGTWSNSPLSYSYQWEKCGVGEKPVCSVILGATNQTYTPTEEWARFTVTVTAANAAGAVAVASSNVSAATLPTVTFTKSRPFGGEGTGNGDLEEPAAVAVESASASEGDVWVADTGNDRIEKFTAAGAFVAAYGAKGKENGQFEKPVGIALNQADTYVYVSDAGNERIEVFEAKTGKYVSQLSLHGSGTPAGIATGMFYSRGAESEYFFVTFPASNDAKWFVGGSKLVEPSGGNTIDGDGLKEPVAVAASERDELQGQENRLFITEKGNHRVDVLRVEGQEVWSTTKFGTEGSGEGQFSSPGSIALAPENSGYHALSDTVFVADAGNSRVQQASQSGENPVDWNFGAGQQSLAFSAKPGEGMGDLYVVTAGTTSEKFGDKVAAWAPAAVTINPPEPPSPGTNAVTTVEYDVPVSGTGQAYNMSSSVVAGWGQKDDPTEATAIFPPDEPMGWPAKDYKRATVYYRDADARTVNVISPGGAISTTEYNAKNEVERTLSPDNRAAAMAKGGKSAEVSKELDTENTYNSEGTELQSTLGPQHNVELPGGAQVQARHHTVYGYEEGAPAEGGPYGLPTKTTEGALYSGKEEDIRETSTSYSGQENLGWKLHRPTSVTTGPKGLKLTHTTVYEPSTGEVKETITPAGNPKEKTPHATETIYYTTAKNTTVPACGEHPEWANLPCQTQPAKQPETSGLPNLPVTVTTYNMWDEPEKTTETVGSTTRTKTATYDAAGRLKTSAVSSSVGTALPSVTDEYSSATGALEKQSTTTEGKTKKITSAYNSLGQLTSYTDADENTSTYEYDIDGRITKTNDGKGTQTYTYDPTTGDLTKLVDSAAGTFTATYDSEGNMLSEGYPNGMSAAYTYDQTGKPISLTYTKTTHCSEKCVWFSDTVVPSIHGQWLSQTSTLSSQSYSYDEEGRLTQVQSTPVGKGCTTRIYGYDEDTNRTSLTTREPNAKGECASEGGTIEKHTYDSADRLHDSGTTYSTFGNITALPATDAGGSELTSTYYSDNQLASQTQAGQTVGYNLDPAGRTRETVSTGTKTADVIAHYAAPGSNPAWTANTSGEWTRNIPGIAGSLSAIQNNGETPVLQLTNLHGDIIATAYLSETAGGLASTADTSEFGVPAVSAPPKYSWLGSIELPSELPSGVIDMGARSYVPQLGRFLQPDPLPGGSANAYTYTFGDPVNSMDPSGALTYGFSAWLKEANDQEAQEVVAREVARETLEREEAERRAREAAEAAAAAGPQYAGEGGEEEWGEEEYEEEEGGYEYAADHHGAENSKEEAHVEPAILVQPLVTNGEASSEEQVREQHAASLCQHVAAEDGSEAYEACEASLLGKIKHALGRAWHIVKTAAVAALRSVGQGDLVCNKFDRCLAPIYIGLDADACADGDCQAFSQDLSEYF